MLFIIIVITNIIFGIFWIKAYTREIMYKIARSKFIKKYFKKDEEAIPLNYKKRTNNNFEDSNFIEVAS